MQKQLHAAFSVCLLLACTGSTEGTTRTQLEESEGEASGNTVDQVGTLSQDSSFRITGKLVSGGLQNEAYTGDNDFFGVQLTSFGWLAVSASWTASVDVDSWVMTPAGDVLAQDVGTTNPLTYGLPILAGDYLVRLASANGATDYTLDLDFWPSDRILVGKYTASTVGDSLTSYTFYDNGQYDYELWFAATGSMYDTGAYSTRRSEIIFSDDDSTDVFDFAYLSDTQLQIGRSTYTRE